MNKGIIEQLDDPATIFKYPRTEFVARFIGFNNFIDFGERTEQDGEIHLTAGSHTFRAAKNPGTANHSGKKGRSVRTTWWSARKNRPIRYEMC